MTNAGTKDVLAFIINGGLCRIVFFYKIALYLVYTQYGSFKKQKHMVTNN